jgi:hypothetical protein
VAFNKYEKNCFSYDTNAVIAELIPYARLNVDAELVTSAAWVHNRPANFQIDKDFDLMYPGRGNGLFEKWPTVAGRALREIKKNIRDKLVLQNAQMATEDGTGDKGEMKV